MASTLKLQIITPDGTAYSEDVDMVTLPGIEGQMGVFPQHVPLMTQMAPGEIIVHKEGHDYFLAVGEGLVEIASDHVIILTDLAIAAEKIDEAKVEEPIARGAGQMTLFIPHGVEGFVSRADGAVSLRNILIPAASKPRPQPAVEAAARLIRNLQLPAGTVTLLYVGSAGGMPVVKLPEDTNWTWNRVTRAGEPADVILQTAADLAADLIVMTTDGPDGFLDGLRGTTSERVLRKARCPVANLPVGSMLG